MQQESITSVILKYFTRFILILCLIFLIVQFNEIEKRIIGLEKNIASVTQDTKNLKSSVSDMQEKLSRASFQKTSETAASPATAKFNYGDQFLHPELPNLLEEDPFVMTAPEAKLNGTLTRRFGGDPVGFNPITVNAADVSEIYSYIRDVLAEEHFLNPDKFGPGVAYRAEMSDEGKCFTFYLKRGVKWHRPLVDWNNSKYEWLKGDHYVTAHDFVFAYETLMNPQVEASASRNYYEDIESVTAITDYILQIRWKRKLYNAKRLSFGFEPIPKFLYSCDETGEPFPKEIFGLKFNEHWYNDRAIGNGMYEFTGWTRGQKITLKRNDDYMGEKPAIKTIVWLIYTDTNQNLLKIKSNEIDCTLINTPQWKKNIKEGTADGKFRCAQNPQGPVLHEIYDRLGYTYIGWNSEKALFADKRVRKAMTHALPREKMLKNLFEDMGKIVSGPFFIQTAAYNRNIELYDYNLDKAAALLDEAGWKDSNNDGIRDKMINNELVDFDFPLLVWNTSEEYQILCKVFKEKLYEIGVRMTIQAVDWAVMQKKMKDRDFYAYTGGWALSWVSDPYQLWHSSQAIAGGSNYVSFKNTEADSIIEKLRVEFDEDTRLELYHRFHEIIHEEQPYTFFMARKDIFAYWEHVKRMVIRKNRPHTVSSPWYIE